MFGGFTFNNMSFGDTWVWNGKAQAWTPQNPATSPSARRTSLATDPSGNVMLFGGSDAANAFADTWVWNGTTWQQQFPPTSPSARDAANIVFDPNLREDVLFGGYVGLTDTWTWNGSNWTQISPAGGSPHDRYAFGMAYDSAAQADVIFGGFSSGPALNDAWELGLLP
jgi:hypothetical protein